MQNDIYNLVEKVKKEPDFIDFTTSNFTDLDISFPANILTAAASKYLAERHYEPDSKGLLPAREAIARYYATERKLEISPDNILITSSSSESYNLLFQLFTSPGDEILLPTPSYPLFAYFAELNKIKVKYYLLDRERQWQIDIHSLTTQITEKTKFIVLITPNNPTGQIISQAEYDSVSQIAAEKGIMLIVDEVFSDFVYQGSNPNYLSPASALHSGASTGRPVTFVLNGISKIFALPDLKLSWIAVTGKANEVTSVVDKLETANDAFLNANYLTQSMLADMFEQGSDFRSQLRALLQERAEQMNAAISKINDVKFTPIRGGIHAIISISKEICKLSEEELVMKLLEERHILVHPGYFYDYESEGYVNLVVTSFRAVHAEKLHLNRESMYRRY